MSTATKLSQKDYLKKYLSGANPDGKKKKKKKSTASVPVVRAKVKLIDDDVDISKLQPLDESALDLFELTEDAPQVVGIVDERPANLQALDYFKQGQRWKVIGNAEGDVSVSVSGGDKQPKSVTVSSGDEEEFSARPVAQASKRTADLSPPRRSKPDHSDESPPRRKRQNASDESPPRKRQQSNSDPSPPRKGSRHGTDLSPPRRKAPHKSSSGKKQHYDSDASPPRKRDNHDSDVSPVRLKKSSSRPKQHYDSDASPPRKRDHKDSNPPPQQKAKNYDSDESPPRRRQAEKSLSPPRKKPGKPSRHMENDSDESPPRRKSRGESESTKRTKFNHENTKGSQHDDKMKKTLDGKVAGLQDSKKLKQELLELKQREESVFAKMDDTLSGRGAVAIQRDRRTGLKRDLEQEQAEQRAKDERENKSKEKYSRWGKGLKQTEDQQEKLARDLHEMSKPLARYADDADLDSYLREQDREGDPMLEYLKNKKREELKSKVPVYQGSFPPNRYDIRPGYRWDGVDRSNGYEQKRFEAINAKKAIEEEAYKWSTSDM